MRDSRLTIFSMMFGVIYLAAFYWDLALFRYYPEVGQFRWLRTDELGLVILWYGWIATAALGALVFGLVAAILPERWTQRVWPDWQWVVPAFAMIACVYLTLPWFRL